jgi:hypothetical protein
MKFWNISFSTLPQQRHAIWAEEKFLFLDYQITYWAKKKEINE